MAVESYKRIQQLTATMQALQNDLTTSQLAQFAPLPYLPEVAMDEDFRMEQHDSKETFEAFCKKLDDDITFKKTVVRTQ